MACFDVNFQAVPCNSNNCVGSDDPSNESCGGWSPENWGNELHIPDAGLDGLYAMSEEEFMDWFEDLHPWGEPLDAFIADQSSDVVIPELISWGEAQEFAEMFSGYDPTQELYILGQLAQTSQTANEMYDNWVNDAQWNLHEKLERQFGIKENMKEKQILAQEQSESNKAYNQRVKNLQLQKEKRKVAGVGATGKDVSKEEGKLERTLSQMMTEYLDDKNIESENLKSKIDSLDKQYTDNVYLSQVKTQNIIDRKRSAKDQMLLREKNRAVNSVIALRDDFEAGVWDMIGSFGHNQAFLQTGDWDG